MKLPDKITQEDFVLSLIDDELTTLNEETLQLFANKYNEMVECMSELIEYLEERENAQTR